MKTLGDVRKFMDRMHIKMEIFGAPVDFQEMFQKKFRGIGEAIVYENGVSALMLSDLPNDTILGNKSSEVFDSLVEWFTVNEKTWVPEEALTPT